MNLAGQSIAILGAGRSGLGASRLARLLGARPVVFDTGDASKLAGDFARLRAESIDLVSGLNDAKRSAATENFDLAVISPGIDAGWELPRLFTSRRVPLKLTPVRGALSALKLVVVGSVTTGLST